MVQAASQIGLGGSAWGRGRCPRGGRRVAGPVRREVVADHEEGRFKSADAARGGKRGEAGSVDELAQEPGRHDVAAGVEERVGGESREADGGRARVAVGAAVGALAGVGPAEAQRGGDDAAVVFLELTPYEVGERGTDAAVVDGEPIQEQVIELRPTRVHRDVVEVFEVGDGRVEAPK